MQSMDQIRESEYEWQEIDGDTLTSVVHKPAVSTAVDDAEAA